ncbi:MAG TPA: NUDIX hydrolase [Acidimicrobiales bacterium]|nr:NUDIX hydrolase [Acidimicrobiales bacterium]
MDDLSGQAGPPDETAGPGGRPEHAAGPGGRQDETATEPVVAAAGGVVWRRGEGNVVEVVLVHRPRYDDWSLPKGKLEAGEDHVSAALREVEEETGLRCVLDEPLPESRYRDRRGRLKVVRYWLMHPVAGATEPSAYATGEVDQAVWRAVDDAVALATYERDRDLIQTAAALVRART